MNLLASIKEDHRMTLNHWRYRVLHWCFNVNPSSPNESPLSRAFYTHYCPLFHVTNLIVIFSPAIFAGKVFWVFGEYGITGAAIGVNKLHDYSMFLFEHSGIKENMNNRLEKMLQEKKNLVNRNKQNRRAKQKFLEIIKNSPDRDFDSCWELAVYNRDENGCWYYLKEEEAKELWDKNSTAITVIREQHVINQQKYEALRKRRQEQLAFWVEFSRIFIKGGLNVFYFIMFLTVCYATYIIAGPTWMVLKTVCGGIAYCFGLLMEINLFSFLTMAANNLFRIAAVAATSFLGYSLIRMIPFTSLLKKVCFPFEVVGEIGVSFINWVVGIHNGTVEFIKMFYEENCPAIIIVKDETND